MAAAGVPRHDDADYPVILTLAERVDEAALLFLARENPEYRLETMADGRLVVSPLTGTFASMGEAELVVQLGTWNKRARLGRVLPDAAFISNGRLAALPARLNAGQLRRIRAERQFRCGPHQPARPLRQPLSAGSRTGRYPRCRDRRDR